MSVAQELYEGIEIEGMGLTGLITYMRTDSLRLSDEATAAAAQFIKSRYGDPYYPGKPRVFKTKGGAQDAHEAIRPSDVTLEPDQIRQSLSPDQYKLYRLIWLRFVACQMADALLDTISADILSEGYVFRASGHTVAFSGFTAVYEESTDDEKQGESGKPLPPFAEGDPLTALSIEPSQHFTQPPARYTEASLVRAMEERGIGRPSTYAPTISTIETRNYVTKESRSLRPTPLGEGVTGLLVDKFKSVADYEFTANMENELDLVEDGKENYVDCCAASTADLKARSIRLRPIWRASASRSRMRKPTSSATSAAATWSSRSAGSASSSHARASRSARTPRPLPRTPAQPARCAA